MFGNYGFSDSGNYHPSSIFINCYDIGRTINDLECNIENINDDVINQLAEQIIFSYKCSSSSTKYWSEIDDPYYVKIFKNLNKLKNENKTWIDKKFENIRAILSDLKRSDIHICEKNDRHYFLISRLPNNKRDLLQFTADFSNDSQEGIKKILEEPQFKEVHALINSSIFPSPMGSGKCSLLWRACYFSKPDLVNFLLSTGVDPNIMNDEQSTALAQVANSNGTDTDKAEILEALHKHGAILDVRDPLFQITLFTRFIYASVILYPCKHAISILRALIELDSVKASQFINLRITPDLPNLHPRTKEYLGYSLLEFICDRAHNDIAHKKDYVEVIEFLVNQGAAITKLDWLYQEERRLYQEHLDDPGNGVTRKDIGVNLSKSEESSGNASEKAVVSGEKLDKLKPVAAGLDLERSSLQTLRREIEKVKGELKLRAIQLHDEILKLKEERAKIKDEASKLTSKELQETLDEIEGKEDELRCWHSMPPEGFTEEETVKIKAELSEKLVLLKQQVRLLTSKELESAQKQLKKINKKIDEKKRELRLQTRGDITERLKALCSPEILTFLQDVSIQRGNY